MSIYNEVIFDTESVEGCDLKLVNKVDCLGFEVFDWLADKRLSAVALMPEQVAVLEAALYKWRMQHEFENMPYPGMPKED